MPSIKEAVRTAIDQDVFLQEGFARDILNKRAVARWLMKHRGIEGNFETIYDIVEEYEPADRDHHRAPWEEVAAHWISGARPVSVLNVRRTAKSFQRLSGLFDSEKLPYQSSYRIIPSQGSIAVVVEDKHEQAVVEALGAEIIIPSVKQFFEFALRRRLDPRSEEGAPPEKAAEGEALEESAGGSLALIVLALESAGIPVPYLANGTSEKYFLVPLGEKTKACKLINELLVDPILEAQE